VRIAFIVHGHCPPAVEEMAVALVKARHNVRLIGDTPFENFGRRLEGLERVVMELPGAGPASVRDRGRQLTWQLRDWRPDVVHAFGFSAGVVAQLAVGDDVPVVQSVSRLAATQRRLGALSPAVSARMVMERRVMDRAAMVVADGADQAMEVLRSGVQATRVVTVTPGVDWHRYPVTPLPRRSSQRPWCLFHPGGSLAESGLEDAMAAISGMANVHLTVAGTREEDAPMLRSAARRWRVQDRLALHGHVPASAMPGMYVAADAVIIPPRQGSSGRLALEALSSGRPVIATACGGILDVVEDGRTGFVAPPRDPGSLATAVKRAMTASRTTLEDMALDAVTRVRQDHAWQQRLPYLTSVYELVGQDANASATDRHLVSA
jgi:D-inositol-3-phosphate glycosyltransferase